MATRVSLFLLLPFLLCSLLWTEKCCGQSNAPAVQNLTIYAMRLMTNTPNSNNKGRVELQVTDTVWGTICPSSWNDYDSSNNANVTCYMLGFRNGGRRVNNTFGSGSKNFVIQNATCSANATSWYQCTQYFAKTCGPQDEEFAVECNPDPNGKNVVQLLPATSIPGSGGLPQVAPVVNPILLNGTSTATCTPNPLVRLYGGDLINTTVGNGYVQVYVNGNWGFVCDETWNQAAAKLVCKELCYDNANGFTPLPGIIAQSVPKPVNRTFLLNGTSCLGNETSVLSCPVVDNSSCPVESLLAGVQCRPDCCTEKTTLKPDVNCSSDALVANFSRFPLVTVNNVFLVNNAPSQCMNLTSNLGYVMANISVASACGAVMQENTTHITYTVSVRVLWLSGGAIINSYTNTRYDLVCSVPRIYTVTNRMEPYTQAPNVTIYQQYNYSLSLDLFTNCNFTQITDSVGSVYLVEVGQWLNVSVSIINYDNRTKLVITDCDAYPVMPYSAYTPVAKLIQDKCPVDSTLTMYSIDNRRQGFQVKAFMFAGYSMVYMRCSVNICLPNSMTYDCSRSCTKQTRRRRKRETSALGTISLDTKSIFLYDPKNADTFLKLLGGLGQSQENVAPQSSDVVPTVPVNQGPVDTKQQVDESTMRSIEQPATQPVVGTTRTVRQLSEEPHSTEDQKFVSNNASAESSFSEITTAAKPNVTSTTVPVTEKTASTKTATVATTTVPVTERTREAVTSVKPQTVTTTTVQLTQNIKESFTSTRPPTVTTKLVQTSEKTRETDGQLAREESDHQDDPTRSQQEQPTDGELNAVTEASPSKNIGHKSEASELKGEDPNRATGHHLNNAIFTVLISTLSCMLI